MAHSFVDFPVLEPDSHSNDICLVMHCCRVYLTDFNNIVYVLRQSATSRGPHGILTANVTRVGSER